MKPNKIISKNKGGFKKPLFKMKNKQDKKIALGKKLHSWVLYGSSRNSFGIKVFENGIKMKKNKAEIILNDFEMCRLNILLTKFFKDREEKKKNNDMLNELEK